MQLLTNTNKYIGLKMVKEFQSRNMINSTNSTNFGGFFC